MNTTSIGIGVLVLLYVQFMTIDILSYGLPSSRYQRQLNAFLINISISLLYPTRSFSYWAICLGPAPIGSRFGPRLNLQSLMYSFSLPQWHGDLSCEAAAASSSAGAGAPLLSDSELIKLCPMCRVPIEKDEGCAQMMCKRCKHVFCWYCLASLDVSKPC